MLAHKAIAIAAALSLSIGLSHLGITMAAADGAQVIASIALNTTVPVGAGSRLNFNVHLTCVELSGDNPSCNDVKVIIPIPDDFGVVGAASPKDWPFISVGVLSGSNQLVSTAQKSLDGSAWEIVFDRNLIAGESARIQFYLTPPAGFTPNQTSFQLSGTVTSSDDSGSEYSTSLGTSTPAILSAVPVCTVTPTGAQPATQINDERKLTFVITTANTGTGSLAVDPATVADSKVTITLPSEYSFVSVADQNGNPLSFTGSAPGPLVFAMPTLGTPTADPQIVFKLTSPPTATATAQATAIVSYTGIGNSAPTTCTAVPVLPVSGSIALGLAAGKNATGNYNSGNTEAAVGTTSGLPGLVNYARADREPAVLPAITNTTTAENGSIWSLALNRRGVTLKGIHFYDGIPCLTSGTGTLNDPFLSLAEGTLCTAPAFRVSQLRATAGVTPLRVLDNMKLTVFYTDGSTELATFGPTAYWVVPANKMVAAVLWEGDYLATNDFSQITLQLIGWPVASLPIDSPSYMVNHAEVIPQPGSNYPKSGLFVGMQVAPEYAVLRNQAHSTIYNYSPGWTGSQSYTSGAFNAVSSLDSFQDSRRLAVVFPAGSGINVTGVNFPAPLTKQYLADYDGNGTSIFLADLSDLRAGGQPATFTVNYSGMPPGTYTYWTYSGFIGLEPSDAGDACVGADKEIVVDLTGIIGPVGVANTLCKAKQTITVQGSSGGLDIVKTVANVSDGAPLVGPPSVVSAKGGDLVQFNLQISNSSYLPLTDVVVYDVLPHVGDTGISSMLSGFERGSTFAPRLTSVDAPAAWTVDYSTSFNPCRPELDVAVGCDPDVGTHAWQSELPPGAPLGESPGAVRLKIDTLAPHEVVNVTLSYQLPDNVSADFGKVAWNNIAGIASLLGRPMLMTETPRVGFELANPVVDPDPEDEPDKPPALEEGKPNPEGHLARAGSADFTGLVGGVGVLLITTALWVRGSARRRWQ